MTVFLDRDGTLNPDPGYIGTPAAFELLPGVGPALATLMGHGARLVVVTNQSGIARGKFTLGDLAMIHAKMRGLLDAAGACLDGVYFCPHHPDEGCRCRKPGTGMVERAAADLPLDLSRAYVIGDQAGDIEMAKRFGGRSVLVTTGTASPQALAALLDRGLPPDGVAHSLPDAVDWIMEDAARHLSSARRTT